MKSFALIGAAGYIAPRHMKAIKDTNNNLLAALDKSDSVGVIDSYFPEADFFTEFERFDRHLDKLKRKGKKIDYISICSPNYLHDAHIRFALRSGSNAICEKPIVLNPWNLDALMEIENESKNTINTILQLRLHPEIIKLKKKIETNKSKKIYNVKLNYIVGRGNWYFYSWKGNVSKSGGVITNIGIHLFDILIYLFGKVEQSKVLEDSEKTIKGNLVLKNANIEWVLSVDRELLGNGENSRRFLKIDDDIFDFSNGFEDLHTKSYTEILTGNGFTLEDSRGALELVYNLRNLEEI